MSFGFVCLTNAPDIPPQHRRSDMCETCESVRTENKIGHDTFLAYGRGYSLTDGTHLWFCSKACFNMSPVPTIDDGRWP